MHKKILILSPSISLNGEPVSARTKAYMDFFTLNGIETVNLKAPSSIGELMKIIYYIYKYNISNILLTMPHFRNWILLYLPGITSILDIRDGWSIAIKTGYGGSVKPNIIKAYIAQLIEYMGIKVASLAITCTPGLQNYLYSFANKKILLIPNGYSAEDLKIVNGLKVKNTKDDNKQTVKFICAGKFSEYGKDIVKIVLNKIYEKYNNKNIILQIVGADKDENLWIQNYIDKKDFFDFHIELIDRITKKELYQMILESDITISLIRDPQYDLGTKIFDYILCSKPVLNYFDKQNNFLDFFNTKYNDNAIVTSESFLRSDLINKKKKVILDILK